MFLPRSVRHVTQRRHAHLLHRLGRHLLHLLPHLVPCLAEDGPRDQCLVQETRLHDRRVFAPGRDSRRPPRRTAESPLLRGRRHHQARLQLRLERLLDVLLDVLLHLPEQRAEHGPRVLVAKALVVGRDVAVVVADAGDV